MKKVAMVSLGCSKNLVDAEEMLGLMKNKGFEIVEIPAYTWAIFKVKGKMPDAFKETYKKICTEFFVQSDYEYASGAELEVYPSANVNDPDYECEIRIAVKNRKENK